MLYRKANLTISPTNLKLISSRRNTMNRLENLLSTLLTVRIEDISQVPTEEQHLLVNNIEELQDQLKTILSEPCFSDDSAMLAPSKPQ